ncbi:MAG: diaminopimelate epimerase [Burkholderiales bacterium]|nr:diaminopimelate epimerase [Burkholderiales bacterium]
MGLRFTKMHGQGNDFVMLNGIAQKISLTPEQIRRIADRHFGIGCDQILLVEAPTRNDTDFRYRIFNADGGEVEQCGNGARCFAHFVRDQDLTDKTVLRVETLAGIIEPSINADESVTVNMGAPRYAPADVPFTASAEAPHYQLDVSGQIVTIGVVSMGNPHAVQVVMDVDTAPVSDVGPRIEQHMRFPKRVNAGFMQVVSRTQIRLRVWERGAGETLACGTGACAAVVTGIGWGLLDECVSVNTLGGELTVRWAGRGTDVFMSGTTATVYSGEIEV